MNALLATLAVLGLFGGEDPPVARTGRPAQPPFEVTLKGTVMVRGLDVMIGELADITPAGRDTLAIGALRFGPSPVLGHTRTITRTEVLQALALAGHDPANFAFKGHHETVVQTIGTDVQPAEFIDAATTALQAVLTLEGGDVEHELAGRVRSMQVPPGRRSMELRARVKGDRTAPASAVVDVEVQVDGERYKVVPVGFKLTRFQNVLKTVGSIRAGAPLSADNVELTRERVAQSTGFYLTSMSQVDGMIARRNLQPGVLLTLSDSAPPAIIRKGEIVTVVLTRGRVKVTVKALANHDAALGDVLALTNLQSRAQLTGVAQGPGLAVVASR
ncbi:MAG: flagellar basal body P-ring formation protein FlgA [Planctomycetes bacterium]|nr:flagellar basal body P-ring formation protein FlgA [Planctomycetota bacterium]